MFNYNDEAKQASTEAERTKDSENDPQQHSRANLLEAKTFCDCSSAKKMLLSRERLLVMSQKKDQ